jgi:hypothetical protein
VAKTGMNKTSKYGYLKSRKTKTGKETVKKRFSFSGSSRHNKFRNRKTYYFYTTFRAYDHLTQNNLAEDDISGH